jgi:dTDP-4-amino-4,6-dideoxygalactose transaminase
VRTGGVRGKGCSTVEVPFVDLKTQHRRIAAEIEAAVQRVLESCAFADGPEVAAFESAFAQFLGAEHCIGVNSGTSALHLALIAAGVAPGEEVICPAFTFISTAWVICYVGARPVFADIDPVTMNIDPASVESCLTEHTKCLLPVDLYGLPADWDRLDEIARARGLPVVEDAAQAHGARWRGRSAGTLGDFGCFSFYPTKNLGAAGEGGAIIAREAAAAERLRRLRDHAQVRRYVHGEVGFNMRMEGIQGAVLAAKLPHLREWNAARSGVAARYTEGLAEAPSLTLPVVPAEAESAWHLYVVRHPQRDALQQKLAEKGIGTAIHYPIPLHEQPALRFLGYQKGDLPHTEAAAAEVLCLPMHAELSDEQVEYVIACVREAAEGLGERQSA